MPSFNCAAVSLAAGSTSTRTTAVLMPASLSAGRKGHHDAPTSACARVDTTSGERTPTSARARSHELCDHTGRCAGRRRLARDHAAAAAVDAWRRGLRRVCRGRRISSARRARPTARRGRAQRTAGPRRRSVPARRQAAHGARRRTCRRTRPSCWPTARRASPRRSRTSGCSATGRTWCSTECGWPRASSAPQRAVRLRVRSACGPSLGRRVGGCRPRRSRSAS